uniref:Uracil-DNA glycosylase-like domain-containing protein n=1 Tax=viral metagenome TaxID=1070528 RepID=A0A6C0H6D9_9ZZZZ
MNYDQEIVINDLLPVGWKQLFDSTILERTQQRLDEAIKQSKRESRNIFPYDPRDIFKVFKLCTLDDIRVVILGQDPYHNNARQANGIAFSVYPGVTIPPSLRNMFKEIQRVYPDTTNTHGDLTDWVKQGVFLLNTALTVVQGQPGSNMNIWSEFTDELFHILENKRNNKCVVYCLWGKFAESKRSLITNADSRILVCSHPSPLSAYKTDTPFMGSGIFKRINEINALNESIKWSSDS